MHEHESEHGHEHGRIIHFVVNNIEHRTKDRSLSTEEILHIAGFTITDYSLVREDAPGEELQIGRAHV